MSDLSTLSELAFLPEHVPWQKRTLDELGAEHIARWLPGLGLLEFESAGIGQWLTKKGEPAKKAKRGYFFTPLGGDRVEFDAVSKIIGCLDKYALRGWYEEHGARGAVKAYSRGLITDETPTEEIIKVVRDLDLGASEALSDASARGSAVHAVMENVALGKPVPPRNNFPNDWLGWYDGAVRAWEALDPEPAEVEEMVCHPTDGYAGRPDIVARLGDTPQMVMRGWAGKRALLDYKTGKGRIYREAHFQTRLYERARRACGLEPCDLIVIVGVTDSGGFVLNEGVVGDGQAEDLLRTYRTLGLVDKAISEARKAA